MEILKRVSKNGIVVGVELDMDGFVCPFPTKGLYSEQILVSLVDAGYKFYDYHGDIVLPNGKSVDELEVVDISTYPEEEIKGFDGMIATAEMQALTDSEASKYYSYRTNMQVIELRKEPSYEINTREEFEAYIRKQSASISALGYSSDNRPINSFVNPAALYTISELTGDTTGNIKKNLHTLEGRRRFKDYTSYQALIKYLMSKGVLNTENPTMMELLQAYYAWGPDGITGTVINHKMKQGVDGSFNTLDDELPASGDKMNHVVANRDIVPYILDTQATLRHLDASTSMDGILEVEEFGRAPLAITTDSAFKQAKRRDNKGYKYSLGYARKSVVTDRIYFTYIVDGYKYVYKASIAGNALFLASRKSAVWTSSVKFSVGTIIGQVDIPISEVKDFNDYILWNICINEAASGVKKNTVEPPVSSTYELLMNIGMSPISAVRYMACHILDDSNFPYQCNYDYRTGFYEGLTIDCVNLYFNPIPKIMYKAFNLNEEEELSVSQFLELADVEDLVYRRTLMLESEITPGMQGYDPTFEPDRAKRDPNYNPENDAINYYNGLKFVADCIDGTISIDAFGDGINADGVGGTKTSADVFMSIIYAELGENPDINKATEILHNLDGMRILNTANLFKKRDNAYKGFLIDYSRARKCKANAKNTWAWAYVSKVFRELGNKPIEQTRPYLLELIVLQNDQKGMVFRNALISAIRDAAEASGLFSKDMIISDSNNVDYGITYEHVAENMLDDVASRLFFLILGKKGFTEDGDDYVYNVKFDLEHSIDVRIPKKIALYCQNVTKDRANHVRYITLFDACEREFSHFSRGGGSFALHIVNADITPWSVAPKKGFKINTYNLLPSYYRQEALVNKFGSTWYEDAINNKSISNIPLCEMLPRLEVPTIDGTEQMIQNDILKSMKSYSDFDSCLFVESIEQVAHYVKRWSAACNVAKERGQIVEHMPLKQDIAYQYLVELLTGNEVQDELRFKDGTNTALSSTETSIIRHVAGELTAIETRAGQNTITLVRPGDISTGLFADIYLTLVSTGKMVGLSGNWVTGIGEQVCIPLTESSHPTMQKLLNEYAVKRGDDYYVVSVKGIYKIGVRL